eukprot:6468590-Amphidinium_carterae.1
MAGDVSDDGSILTRSICYPVDATSSLRGDVKCWRDADGTCRWELRRVAGLILVRRAELALCKVVKASLLPILADRGLEASLVQSHRAAAASGSRDNAGGLHAEYTITSHGLVTLLAVGSVRKRALQDRLQWAAMLEATLTSIPVPPVRLEQYDSNN